jgi:hypothetical protein
MEESGEPADRPVLPRPRMHFGLLFDLADGVARVAG